MRVDVELTLQDFKLFGKAAYRRAGSLPRRNASPWRRRLSIAVAWIVLVCGFAAVRLYIGGAILEHLPLAAFTSLTLTGAFVYFLLDAQRRVHPDASGAILGPKSYQLTDSGVIETSRHVDSTTRWSGVVAIEETEAHIFLFVDRCAGFIIPKRCFSSTEQAKEFREFAEQHLRLSNRRPQAAADA